MGVKQGIPGSGVGPGGAKAPAYDSDPAPGGASPRLNFFGPAPGGAFAPAKDSGPAPGGAFTPAQNSDPAPDGAFAPAEDSGPAPGGVKAPATPDLSQGFMKIFTFLNIPPPIEKPSTLFSCPTDSDHITAKNKTSTARGPLGGFCKFQFKFEKVKNNLRVPSLVFFREKSRLLFVKKISFPSAKTS